MVLTGETKRLTSTFPSYFLGRNPEKRVIEVSYGDDLAKEFGDANRSKIAEHGMELFGITLSQAQASKVAWNLEGHNGGMISVGVGGGITGKGADLLIIDDPIKNREEAESETYRRKLKAEWESSIYTRLHPGAAIIIILTRWHEADLAGTLLEQNGEEWKVLSLTCLCESDDDPLGRKIGEALWPEHGFDERWCEETKRAVGSYAWASLYQQHPSPPEGGILKRGLFKFYEKLPDNLNQALQSWDCTFKEADTNDFVAGHVWAKKGPNYYMLDRIHDRMGISDTMLGVETLAAKWPNARAKCIEEAANGAAVIELLSKKIPGLIPVNPMGGKVSRAQAILPYLEAGNIYLPHPSIAPWIHDFIEECASFPNAAHDDDVDAMTQAITQLDMLFGNGGGMIYRAFSDEPEAYMLPRTVLETKLRDSKGYSTIESVTIGLASESILHGTSIVATAIGTNFKHVYVIGSKECQNNATPNEVANAVVEFSLEVFAKTGMEPDYVVIGTDNKILQQTIATRLRSDALNTTVRYTNGMPEKDMISLTLSLMSSRKLVMSQEDSAVLVEAFMTAQWKDSRTDREDDGSANTLALKAFERSIERHRRALLE